ncbi:MAG: fimbrillin family protein, partial [Bacteroidales bacterium]|nr:fimbrillin family protein [Bacteroidales bacterium]
MKQYFFLAAIAAVTLGSCTNEEIGERSILPNEDGRTPIAITTYLQQTTRGYNAQEATASALTGSGGGFNLLAVTADATSPETIVDNWTFVVSNTESGACSPANTSLMPYWPSDKDQKVNFYASYPAGGASASANCTPDSETGTLAITTDGTIDILAAYPSASIADNNGSISLQFRHVLAQTIISVKGNTTGLPTGTAYSLKSLSLSAPNQATYTFSSGEVVANADAVTTYDFHNATSDAA